MKNLFLVLATILILFGCSNPVNQSEEEYEVGESKNSILEDKGDYYLLGGDMILNKNDEYHEPIINALLNVQNNMNKAMMQVATQKWPGGNIPYYFTEIADDHKLLVRQAMDYVESICKVNFYETSPTPRDYKYEIKWYYTNLSTAGYCREAGMKIFSRTVGVIVHELLHCLGFGHEHQRYDRDFYIYVNPSVANTFNYNIVPQYLNGILFSKVLGPYDYYSVMHYGRGGYSGNPNIEPLDPDMKYVIGQRRGMSLQDRVYAINLYGKNTSFRVNYKIGDFNGDGRSDFLKFENGSGWRVFTSNGGGFADSIWSSSIPGTKWNICNYVGDFNGDGKDDFMMFEYRSGLRVYASTGNSFSSSKWINLAPGNHDDIVGDFNGDGKDDFVRYIANTGWRVYLSTGSSFTNAGTWSNVLFQSSYDLGKYLGDFNGDGKDDLLLYNRTSGWRVLLSTGSSFTNSIWNTWTTGTKYVIGDSVGDFNGDGKDDFIFYCYRRGTKLLLSTGSSFTGSWVPVGPMTRNQIGDFNGDGKDDVVRIINDRYRVSLSTGTSFTSSYWIDDFDIDNFYISDFNGDNKDDIFQYADQSWWRVLRSNGTSFFRSNRDPRVAE